MGYTGQVLSQERWGQRPCRGLGPVLPGPSPQTPTPPRMPSTHLPPSGRTACMRTEGKLALEKGGWEAARRTGRKARSKTGCFWSQGLRSLSFSSLPFPPSPLQAHPPARLTHSRTAVFLIIAPGERLGAPPRPPGRERASWASTLGSLHPCRPPGPPGSLPPSLQASTCYSAFCHMRLHGCFKNKNKNKNEKLFFPGLCFLHLQYQRSGCGSLMPPLL